MKLENQVTTLAQSKRLAELGINAKSGFYWVPWKASDFDGAFLAMGCNKGFVRVDEEGEVETLDAPTHYPAYTLSELLCMMLSYAGTLICPAELYLIKDRYNTRVAYMHDQLTEGGYGPTIKQPYKGLDENGDTEITASYNMLCSLLTTNLCTATECNNRLNQAI